MLEDRLSDIAILSVHSQRANAPDLDLVVDKFANKYILIVGLYVALSVTNVGTLF